MEIKRIKFNSTMTHERSAYDTLRAVLYPNLNVALSWGSQEPATCYTVVNYYGEDVELITLRIKVNGLLHKGYVYIAYDEGADMHRVSLDGLEFSDKLFFDELQSYIDARVERRPEWTDEEYSARIKAEELKEERSRYA